MDGMDKALIEKVKGPVLDNDYPVYVGYVYFADDVVIRSPLTGIIQDIRAIFKEDTVFNSVKYDEEIDHLFI